MVRLIVLVFLLLEGPAFACSTFCLRFEGRTIFAKNYDWSFEEGFLIVNQRERKHSSDSKSPAKWTSRYGSVTFNQYGRNFPSGGINEAGLVVELLWSDGSRYPKADARPTVGCLEWIQYQLDTAATVSEVIASDSKVRIESEVPLHYLIADKQGNVATIEFIGRKLVVHTGTQLPVAALTNNHYEDSLEFLQKRNWIPTDAGSLARFVRAANHVKNFRSGEPVSYAFDSLADVSSALTQWSIVYEIDRGIIHFRTRSNPEIRTLALKDLDFLCSSQVLFLDLMEKKQGDIRAELRQYTTEANLSMLRSNFPRVDFLKHTSDAELQRIAKLPEKSSCQTN